MNTIPNTTETTPKAPRTEAQIAASRLNGAKSRGPITDEGKAISSQNSLRHGLLAKMVLIEGESETAFRQLSESLHRAFAPASARAARQGAGTNGEPLDAAGRALSEDVGTDFDEYENNLLDTMALSAWRRMRAVGMETAAVTLQIKSNRDFAAQTTASPDTGTATYNAFAALLSNSPAFELVLRYEARHARAYERAAKALRDYRKGTGRDIHENNQTNPTPSPDPPTDHTPTNRTDHPPTDHPSTNRTDLAPDHPPTDRTPSEPRASASGPQIPTNAAPSLAATPTQPQNQPNEPEPHPAPAVSNTLTNRSARWHKRQARLARRKK